MNILHTESSNGWGGQEIRILREAEGMRSRGHQVIFAVVKGGRLVEKARALNFIVYELSFRKSNAIVVIAKLLWILQRHHIDLVNTHSSLDAWLGGIAARIMRKKIVRTRHLSTPIRKGLNSKLLYRTLADAVATTASSVVPMICRQAQISTTSCRCIPTGVIPFSPDPQEVADFRRLIGAGSEDLVVGTVCVIRSWKGIKDLMQAANALRSDPRLKWVIVGGGYIEQYKDWLDLRGVLTFTGHVENPAKAFGAIDIFLLLSTAHEGVSQAVLQAAYLGKTLITTDIGGLPEVCKHGETGLVVPPLSPDKVAAAVKLLSNDKPLRLQLGSSAQKLVRQQFMFDQTLDHMESLYLSC